MYCFILFLCYRVFWGLTWCVANCGPGWRFLLVLVYFLCFAGDLICCLCLLGLVLLLPSELFEFVLFVLMV